MAKGRPASKCYPFPISLNGEAFEFGSRLQVTCMLITLPVGSYISLLFETMILNQRNPSIYQRLEPLSWLSYRLLFPFAIQGRGLQLCPHITMFTRCGQFMAVHVPSNHIGEKMEVAESTVGGSFHQSHFQQTGNRHRVVVLPMLNVEILSLGHTQNRQPI